MKYGVLWEYPDGFDKALVPGFKILAATGEYLRQRHAEGGSNITLLT